MSHPSCRHLPFRAGRKAFPAVVLVLSLIACGCVPYQTFEVVKAERDKLKSAHDALTQQYNRALQEILRLGKEGAGNEAMRQQVANLERLNGDLKARLEQVGNQPLVPGDLTPGLRDAGATITDEGALSLPGAVLFASGLADLKGTQAGQVLDEVKNLLDRHSGHIIHITGHTDDEPLKSTKGRWGTNQFLGYNRAYQVFKYLMDHGIEERRMVCHSYADLLPAADGAGKDADSKNRRVVIHLSKAARI